MPPDRLSQPDIATDAFWDDYATAGSADAIAVDPADVAAIRYLHTHAAHPQPMAEFAERLRATLLAIGNTEDPQLDQDDDTPTSNGLATPSPALPAVIPSTRRRRWPLLAAAALVALLLAGIALWQLLPGNDHPTTIPAIMPPIETATSLEMPVTPRLPSIELPASAIPWDRFGITFDHRSMPPQSESEDALNDSLKLRYLLSGSVEAQSDGPMRVFRETGDGTWEEAPPGIPITLETGDALFVDDGASITFTNHDSVAAIFLAWSLYAGGGDHGNAPAGWTLDYQDYTHILSLSDPGSSVRLQIGQTELGPSEDLLPPAGALVHQFIYLSRNAAGEQVAPIFGNLADGGTRNMGRQALTIYELIIEPVGT